MKSVAEQIAAQVWTDGVRFVLVAISPVRRRKSGRECLEDRPARLAAFDAATMEIARDLDSETVGEHEARERAAALKYLSFCGSRAETIVRIEKAIEGGRTSGRSTAPVKG